PPSGSRAGYATREGRAASTPTLGTEPRVLKAPSSGCGEAGEAALVVGRAREEVKRSTPRRLYSEGTTRDPSILLPRRSGRSDRRPILDVWRCSDSCA